MEPIEVKVLDHGFVRLVDMMGNDWSPVKAARISYAQGLKGEDQDRKLLKYLLKNKHTSPFEQVILQWEIKAPIFVFREWHRHRTARLNEFSMRYSNPFEKGMEFYRPDYWRLQDTKNKQGSLDSENSEQFDEVADSLVERVETVAENSYRALIQMGVAREQARIVLPVSIYSVMVWQSDLHNTWHFLDLRTAENAQWEIRQYALAMETIIEQVLPILMKVRNEVRYGL